MLLCYDLCKKPGFDGPLFDFKIFIQLHLLENPLLRLHSIPTYDGLYVIDVVYNNTVQIILSIDHALLRES